MSTTSFTIFAKPRIIYVAKHQSGGNDDEGAIAHALEKLGCEVIRVHENEGHKALGEQGDLLLFHKWQDERTIRNIRIPKVFWYFDKVDFNGPYRERWMRAMIPIVDQGFLTDGEFATRMASDKLCVLRQGFDTRFAKKGEKRETNAKIAFVGSVYGSRAQFAARMNGRFGENFRMFIRCHQRQLSNLCESVPIFVAPPYPAENKYWSNRVYVITGHGGFLIHPYCEELAQEYEDGKEIVFYKDEADLYQKVDYYLRSPSKREAIQEAGRKKTQTHYSYLKRCQALLNHIRQKSIGTPGQKRA